MTSSVLKPVSRLVTHKLVEVLDACLCDCGMDVNLQAEFEDALPTLITYLLCVTSQVFVACKTALAHTSQYAKAWIKGRQLPGSPFAPLEVEKCKVAEFSKPCACTGKVE